MTYNSNVKATSNHLRRAVEYASQDVGKNLYSKTKNAYDDTVGSLVQLADALSRILDKKVTIMIEDVPVDQQLAFHIPTVYQQVESVNEVKNLKKKVKKLTKQVYKQNETIKAITDFEVKQAETVDKIAEGLNSVTDMFSMYLQHELEKQESSTVDKSSPINSEEDTTSCKRNVQRSCKKDTVQEERVSDLESEHPSTSGDTVTNRSVTSNRKKDVFKGTKVRKAFQKYSDSCEERHDFGEVLVMAPQELGVPDHIDDICHYASTWYIERFLDRDMPVDKNGNNTYHLYQFPRVFAYYVAVCAKMRLEDPNCDMNILYEFVRLVRKNKKLPYLAPTILCAGSDERIELSDRDVLWGYAYWVQIVEMFNSYAREHNLSVHLTYDVYPAKMFALGFATEERACMLNEHSFKTYNIDDPDVYLTDGNCEQD